MASTLRWTWLGVVSSDIYTEFIFYHIKKITHCSGDGDDSWMSTWHIYILTINLNNPYQLINITRIKSVLIQPHLQRKEKKRKVRRLILIFSFIKTNHLQLFNLTLYNNNVCPCLWWLKVPDQGPLLPSCWVPHTFTHADTSHKVHTHAHAPDVTLCIPHRTRGWY